MNIKFSLYDFIRLKICPFNIIDVLIKNNNIDNILEVGCGKGAFFRNFIKNTNFKQYVGTDNNAKSINKLKNYNNKNTLFCSEDIEETINRVRLFDCILLVDVLHHIEKKRQKIIINKIIDNLKPNAFLIYKDISNKNKLKGFINILHDLLLNFDFISYYQSKKIIAHLSKKKDFEIVDHFFIKKYWYDHEFLIIKRKAKYYYKLLLISTL